MPAQVSRTTLSHPEPDTVTPDSMRQVMSQFATGVVVLTVGDKNIHGMTANAFSSVSLKPPLVLCCIANNAVMHRAIMCAGAFAVSIMRADQEHLARYFADRGRPLGHTQFKGVDWLPGPRTGAPLLAGSLGWLECDLADFHEAGDHSVFFGTVLSASRGPAGQGLLFFNGGYHQVVSHQRGLPR